VSPVGYNVRMNAAPLTPLSPKDYLRAMHLVPDEPQMIAARAALLAQRGAIFADDPDHPAMIAVATGAAPGQTFFLCGDPESAGLAAFVRALPGPALLHADREIGARIPAWRPDTHTQGFATFTLPATGTAAAFAALPPGGVRRLRPNDARHLADLPAWLWGIWETPEALLRAAPAYARYLRGELVSVACVVAETERYARIAAYTIARTRRNGFARECAQRLIGAIVTERGKQPVLTAATNHAAAIGLAASLGMTARADYTGYVLP
jgi:hypothetical protein